MAVHANVRRDTPQNAAGIRRDSKRMSSKLQPIIFGLVCFMVGIMILTAANSDTYPRDGEAYQNLRL